MRGRAVPSPLGGSAEPERNVIDDQIQVQARETVARHRTGLDARRLVPDHAAAALA